MYKSVFIKIFQISSFVSRSITLDSVEHPPYRRTGEKDTREWERWPGCMPEPNDSCSCTIVYGGVWRTELTHTVFMKNINY